MRSERVSGRASENDTALSSESSATPTGEVMLNPSATTGPGGAGEGSEPQQHAGSGEASAIDRISRRFNPRPPQSLRRLVSSSIAVPYAAARSTS